MAYGKIGWYFCVADSTFHRTLQAQLSAVSPWISRATQNQVTQRSHHSRWRGTRCATAKGSFLWANSGSKIHQVQRWLCHQIKSRKVNGGFTYHLFPGLLYLLHFIYLVYLGLFKQQWRSSADVQNILHHKSTWVSNYKPFGIPPFFLRPPKITKSKWPKSSTSQHPSTPPKKTKKNLQNPEKKMPAKLLVLYIHPMGILLMQKVPCHLYKGLPRPSSEVQKHTARWRWTSAAEGNRWWGCTPSRVFRRNFTTNSAKGSKKLQKQGEGFFWGWGKKNIWMGTNHLALAAVFSFGIGWFFFIGMEVMGAQRKHPRFVSDLAVDAI